MVAAAGEVAVVAVVAAAAVVVVDGLAVTATPSATAAGKCVDASIARHLATAFLEARRLCRPSFPYASHVLSTDHSGADATPRRSTLYPGRTQYSPPCMCIESVRICV